MAAVRHLEFLPRDVMHISAAWPMPSRGVRLSIRCVTFVYSLEMSKYFFFTVGYFHTKRYGNIPTALKCR